MSWHTTTFAQRAETASKIMACAALFSIVLPREFPNTFLLLFLICSIIGGNYKFKFKLIANNSVALIALAISLLFLITLTYTSASVEDAIKLLRRYGRFVYIPLLLGAFYEQRWKRIGYIAFLSGVTLILLMSYMLVLAWPPEIIYLSPYYSSGKYSPYTLFHNYIAYGILVAYAAYLYLHHALDTDNKVARVFFIVLAALASFNIFFIGESRISYMLWVFLLLLLIYQHLGWKRMVLGLVIVPVLAATAMTFSDQARTRWTKLQSDMESIEQNDYSNSFGYRALWAEVGWDIFKDNPVLGTGVGSFRDEFRKRREAKGFSDPARYYDRSPHNEYVSVGVQLGLIGLVFLIALYIQQWRVSSRLPLFSNYAAKGMVLTMVVSGMGDSVFHPRVPGLFFVLFTALLFSSYTPNRSPGDIR